MKLIKIGDLHITITGLHETLTITDFLCHLVGQERTGDVIITVTPDNNVKVRYKANKKEDSLNLKMPDTSESGKDTAQLLTSKLAQKFLKKEESK